MTTVCKHCGKKAVGRFLCRSHYNAIWRKGKMDELHKHPVAGAIRRDIIPTEERFKKKYKISPNGCWEWFAAKDQCGYGTFWNGIHNLHAHRYSYILHVAPIPKGKYVCHTCDNPSCVNPKHLFIGNQYDNMRDARLKNRMPQYKLSDEDVRYIQNSTRSVRDLSKMFDVARSTLHRVRKKPPR